MTKDYSNSIRFCDAVNEQSGNVIPMLLRRLSTQFEQHQIDILIGLGFDTIEASLSMSKKNVLVTRVEVDASTVVYIESDGTTGKIIKAHHQFRSLTQPAYVEEFVAAIKKENNGWGSLGTDGLMYRGHNLFGLYTAKSFNRTISELISNDEDLRVGEHCEECKACRVVQDMHLGCGDKAKTLIREAFKQYRALEMLNPEDITSQEVYLGYVPERDVFLSAWDVFGSHNTGSVLIEFAISEDGRILSTRSKEGDWDLNREVDEMCDAFDRKFYDTNPSKNARNHGPMGDGGGRSLYDMIGGGCGLSIIDIRLD